MKFDMQQKRHFFTIMLLFVFLMPVLAVPSSAKESKVDEFEKIDVFNRLKNVVQPVNEKAVAFIVATIEKERQDKLIEPLRMLTYELNEQVLSKANQTEKDVKKFIVGLFKKGANKYAGELAKHLDKQKNLTNLYQYKSNMEGSVKNITKFRKVLQASTLFYDGENLKGTVKLISMLPKKYKPDLVWLLTTLNKLSKLGIETYTVTRMMEQVEEYDKALRMAMIHAGLAKEKIDQKLHESLNAGGSVHKQAEVAMVTWSKILAHLIKARRPGSLSPMQKYLDVLTDSHQVLVGGHSWEAGIPGQYADSGKKALKEAQMYLGTLTTLNNYDEKIQILLTETAARRYAEGVSEADEKLLKQHMNSMEEIRKYHVAAIDHQGDTGVALATEVTEEIKKRQAAAKRDINILKKIYEELQAAVVRIATDAQSKINSATNGANNLIPGGRQIEIYGASTLAADDFTAQVTGYSRELSYSVFDVGYSYIPQSPASCQLISYLNIHGSYSSKKVGSVPRFYPKEATGRFPIKIVLPVSGGQVDKARQVIQTSSSARTIKIGPHPVTIFDRVIYPPKTGVQVADRYIDRKGKITLTDNFQCPVPKVVTRKANASIRITSPGRRRHRIPSGKWQEVVTVDVVKVKNFELIVAESMDGKEIEALDFLSLQKKRHFVLIAKYSLGDRVVKKLIQKNLEVKTQGDFFRLEQKRYGNFVIQALGIGKGDIHFSYRDKTTGKIYAKKTISVHSAHISTDLDYPFFPLTEPYGAMFLPPGKSAKYSILVDGSLRPEQYKVEWSDGRTSALTEDGVRREVNFNDFSFTASGFLRPTEKIRLNAKLVSTDGKQFVGRFNFGGVSFKAAWPVVSDIKISPRSQDFFLPMDPAKKRSMYLPTTVTVDFDYGPSHSFILPGPIRSQAATIESAPVARFVKIEKEGTKGIAWDSVLGIGPKQSIGTIDGLGSATITVSLETIQPVHSWGQALLIPGGDIKIKTMATVNYVEVRKGKIEGEGEFYYLQVIGPAAMDGYRAKWMGDGVKTVIVPFKGKTSQSYPGDPVYSKVEILAQGGRVVGSWDINQEKALPPPMVKNIRVLQDSLKPGKEVNLRAVIKNIHVSKQGDSFNRFYYCVWEVVPATAGTLEFDSSDIYIKDRGTKESRGICSAQFTLNSDTKDLDGVEFTARIMRRSWNGEKQ
jgi:hypothetical protein